MLVPDSVAPMPIKLKRRTEGEAGPPDRLLSAELAYNQIDQTIYIGSGDDGAGNATEILPVAGLGSFLTLATAQVITGAKTFTGPLILTGAATGPMPPIDDASAALATTAWVRGQEFVLKADLTASTIALTEWVQGRGYITAADLSASSAATARWVREQSYATKADLAATSSSLSAWVLSLGYVTKAELQSSSILSANVSVGPSTGPSYAIATPVAAAIVSIAATTSVQIINPAGALASLTLTLPAAADGQRLRVAATQAVVALTCLAPGAAMKNLPKNLGAGEAFEVLYSQPSKTWFRIG